MIRTYFCKECGKTILEGKGSAVGWYWAPHYWSDSAALIVHCRCGADYRIDQVVGRSDADMRGGTTLVDGELEDGRCGSCYLPMLARVAREALQALDKLATGMPVYPDSEDEVAAAEALLQLMGYGRIRFQIEAKGRRKMSEGRR